MVVPRALAWPHFPCLSFSLAVPQCSVFIFVLSPFGSPVLCLLPLLLAPWDHPDPVNLCAPPSLVVV